MKKKRIELIVALSVLTIGAVFGIFALSEQTKRALNEAEVFEEEEATLETEEVYSNTGDEIDMGEHYLKELESEDDIAYDEYGLPYVKNQFLMFVNREASFEEVEALVAEYDGVIVGYIDIGNFYQIDICHDVTIYELYQIIEDVKNDPIVKSAYVNPVIEEVEKAEVSETGATYGNTGDEIDMGERYLKELESEDDIIYNGHGVYYVKNQFVIFTINGISFETVEALAAEYDGVIAGYIEAINLYQVEIRHDVTTDELNQIIDEVALNPIIDYVSVNPVVREEPKVD